MTTPKRLAEAGIQPVLRVKRTTAHERKPTQAMWPVDLVVADEISLSVLIPITLFVMAASPGRPWASTRSGRH